MANKGIIVGSYVVDLMGRAHHIPRPAETVLGNYFKMGPGGKGFNQCVAANKAGTEVLMVTKVGKDAFAQPMFDAMQTLGMDSSGIFVSEDCGTGTALILVDENSGQNAILVTPDACNQITKAEIDSIADRIKESAYLLTQLEINDDALEYAMDIARENGVEVILNPAPAHELPDRLLSKVDIITPNEVEAGALSGIEVADEAGAKKAAAFFHAKGIKTVVITMGSQGAFLSHAGQQRMVPSYRVNAIDTTGAGDAFNGGLLAALLEGKDVFEAAQFASALAALSVQKIGTTPSMPTRAEIDAFLKEHTK